MKKHTSLLICLLLAVLNLNLTAKQNIIVVLTDDQGYRDASCYGCIDFKTPHIDQLAASGIRFTQGYVTHPYCSPSRAGLLAGRYQQSFGHEHNPKYNLGDPKTGTPPTVQLLPQALKNAGYATGGFGKWHLGAGPPFQPHNRGFTHYWGFLGGGHDYFKAGNNPNRSYQSPIWINGKFTQQKVTYITDDITDAALNFIEKNQHKPFFAYIAYNAPHYPDQAKKQDLQAMAHIKHSGRRKYAAMMKNVDDNLGRITQKLDQLKLRDNTLVIYLSDNGGRRRLADNRPLCGNKGWLYEGGIRVPFIISMPGTIPAGITSHQPVSSLDIFPTSLALAKTQSSHPLHGTNLLTLIQQKTPRPRTLHWRVSGGDGWAIRHGNWKLIRDCGTPKPELYNLLTDPTEKNNLAQKHPKKLQHLQQLHNTWNKTLTQPLFSGDGHTDNTRMEYNSTPGHRYFKDVWWKP